MRVEAQYVPFLEDSDGLSFSGSRPSVACPSLSLRLASRAVGNPVPGTGSPCAAHRMACGSSLTMSSLAIRHCAPPRPRLADMDQGHRR